MWFDSIWPNFNLSGLLRLHPIVPTTRIYWPYLLSALLLTLLVFLSKKGYGQKISLKNFLKFAFPKAIYWHRSALLDYFYFFVNQLVYGLLFVPFILSSPLVAKGIRAFLLNIFGLPESRLSPDFSITLIVTVLAAIFADFGQFIAHFLHHKIPFLWNFHKVHHSAEVLTPITVYRAHPVELVIDANLIAVFTGMIFGIFNYFSQHPIGAVMILKLNIVIFLFNIVGSNLRHSHIWISYPGFLSYLFISPAQHQIHHSVKRIHANKNYGSVFAFWDFLFRSLYVPNQEEKFSIGLPHQEHKEFSGLLRFYLLPFKKNFDLVFNRLPKTQGAGASTSASLGLQQNQKL